ERRRRRRQQLPQAGRRGLGRQPLALSRLVQQQRSAQSRRRPGDQRQAQVLAIPRRIDLPQRRAIQQAILAADPEGPLARAAPLIETIHRHQAAPPRERLADRRRLGQGFRAGVGRGARQVGQPGGRQPPARQVGAQRAVLLAQQQQRGAGRQVPVRLQGGKAGQGGQRGGPAKQGETAT